MDYELDYLARERDLEEFKQTAQASKVFAPVSASLAFVQGLPVPSACLVYLGAGFYLQVGSASEAVEVLERILKHKLWAWAAYLDQFGSEEDAQRFADKFNPKKTASGEATEGPKEVVYFEPF
ncbi:hypothetical protein BASA81_000956 [Batrachochytrium salamandrivorans]|nr:hypothetical protein BASA81_012152 [Batrachochytrium salamandrivorans]KAH9261252.1 hypothetical protein BASA81_000956 [Batrachochytrium salamandrivorans]